MYAQAVYHVAFADDWEASLGLGSYEAATRGTPYDPGGYIRATTINGVQSVLDDVYADLALPLTLIQIDVDALAETGTRIEQLSESTAVRIYGPLPCADDTVIKSTAPIQRQGNRWLAPAMVPRSRVDHAQSKEGNGDI